MIDFSDDYWKVIETQIVKSIVLFKYGLFLVVPENFLSTIRKNNPFAISIYY